MPKKKISKQTVKKSKRILTRTSSSRRTRRFFGCLTALGVLILAFSVTHKVLYGRALRMQTEAIAAYQAEQQDRKVVPVELKIPGEWEIPIVLMPFIENQWSISETKANYLGNSAGIGDPENMIIYGHNTQEVLGRIRELRVGDRLEILGSDGREYTYEVSGTQVVSPNDATLLQPTEDHVLTMYTCTGFLDSQRFVVRGRLLE